MIDRFRKVANQERDSHERLNERALVETANHLELSYQAVLQKIDDLMNAPLPRVLDRSEIVEGTEGWDAQAALRKLRESGSPEELEAFEDAQMQQLLATGEIINTVRGTVEKALTFEDGTAYEDEMLALTDDLLDNGDDYSTMQRRLEEWLRHNHRLSGEVDWDAIWQAIGDNVERAQYTPEQKRRMLEGLSLMQDRRAVVSQFVEQAYQQEGDVGKNAFQALFGVQAIAPVSVIEQPGSIYIGVNDARDYRNAMVGHMGWIDDVLQGGAKAQEALALADHGTHRAGACTYHIEMGGMKVPVILSRVYDTQDPAELIGRVSLFLHEEQHAYQSLLDMPDIELDALQYEEVRSRAERFAGVIEEVQNLYDVVTETQKKATDLYANQDLPNATVRAAQRKMRSVESDLRSLRFQLVIKSEKHPLKEREAEVLSLYIPLIKKFAYKRLRDEFIAYATQYNLANAVSLDPDGPPGILEMPNGMYDSFSSNAGSQFLHSKLNPSDAVMDRMLLVLEPIARKELNKERDIALRRLRMGLQEIETTALAHDVHPITLAQCFGVVPLKDWPATAKRLAKYYARHKAARDETKEEV